MEHGHDAGDACRHTEDELLFRSHMPRIGGGELTHDHPDHLLWGQADTFFTNFVNHLRVEYVSHGGAEVAKSSVACKAVCGSARPCGIATYN